jgi:type II secretory pathway component GspD/PulD (secretin)
MRRTVSPATWQQPGCGTEIRGTALIVTAPPAVQREVAAFLATQTAAHSLAVRVELRWLELTDGFDRAIGIQWTNPGYLSQDDGGSIAATVIPTLPSLAVAAPTGGATLAFSLLGEPQLAALVSAIENSEQGRQLEAGDLVCLHGQQANIIFGKQDSFISDYEITEGLYDPVISTLWTGMTVDVRPLVSADRRYVSLELQAATASLRMDTAEFGTIRAVGFTDEEDGLLFHQTYTIELPEVAIREIGNTVMIPDRGCLLIGGFGRIIDQDASAGIPWLAGVPVVGYLFGATRTLRERSQLYLYATVRIIPYDELEARL